MLQTTNQRINQRAIISNAACVLAFVGQQRSQCEPTGVEGRLGLFGSRQSQAGCHRRTDILRQSKKVWSQPGGGGTPQGYDPALLPAPVAGL